MTRLAAPLLICLIGPAEAQTRRFGDPLVTSRKVCADNPDGVLCKALKKSEEAGRSTKPAQRRSSNSWQMTEVQSASRTPRGGGRVTLPFVVEPVQLPAGEARLRFFHSHAGLALGINLAASVQNTRVRNIFEELQNRGLPAGPQASAALPMLADLDQLWLVVSETPGRANEPDIVGLLSGKFTHPMWEQLLGGQSLAGAAAVLVGKPASVTRIRQKLGAPAPLGELAKAVAPLVNSGDAWIVGIPGLMGKGSAPKAAGDMLDKVHRFLVTMSFGDTMEAEATVVTSSPLAAEQILQSYRGFEREIPQGELEAEKELVDLVRSAKVDVVDSTVRFRISVTQEQAQRIARARQAFGTRGRSAGKVVIHGMEGGPREVPLDGQR